MMNVYTEFTYRYYFLSPPKKQWDAWIKYVLFRIEEELVEV